ncbi:unnamed protein product [Paramecium primaurelia]|uniref:Uncharacterized protein n=1 Tax=Paramecium primaurelia TaxID=5886 RepID=A0A8S1L5B5_PARPR|nr:unnamed protein product [Paramecium primaurelia]
MITKMPIRIARTLFSVNFPGSQISIPQSTIEKNQLFQVIENEIMFEVIPINNNQQNLDQTNLNGFKIQDFEDQQRIELSKNVENVQILICIDFQNTVQSKEQENIDSQIIQIQKTSETSLTSFKSIQQIQAPFSVYLTKGNGIISCYECLAYNGNIKIVMVQIVDDVEEHKLIPRENRGLEDYNGNNHHIEDSIQYEMLNYLKTFEIDSELAQFVQNIQIYKEHVLNVNYLQDKPILHD